MSQIYMSEPPPRLYRDSEMERTSNSCPPSPNFVYGFLILFNWNEGLKNPFKIYPRREFLNDIGENCVTQKLSDPYRIKKLRSLKSLPGQSMSMFAKVQDCKFSVHILSILFYIYICFIVF